jgi:exodeoxyribonuclease V alpha subunit
MLKTPKNHLKEPIEKILDKYSKTQNISLSEEQKEAIIDSVSSKIHCIVGYAGTGKSTVLSAITYIYEALGYRIEMAALSGKATLKMIQTSGKSAKTIFRFLTQVKEANAITNSGKKVPRDLSRITNDTVIILDEASMIDLGSMATIFRHLMPGTRLLLVGDDFQLPPIGFGLVFHLLVKNKYLTSKLTRVFRQKESNPIPIVGKQIREGLRVPLPYYNGASIGIHFHETQEELDTEIINKICNDLGGFNAQESNLQIITATNKKAELINNFIHKCHVEKNSKINKNTIVGNSPDINFTIGDVVVFNKNNYQKNLYNGMIGYISKLTTINNRLNYLQLVFDNRTVELKDSLEINDVSLAYALTCHKLQGSQSRNIIIMLENLDLIDPTWFYTAITRATYQVVIIGSRCQYENIFNRTPSYKKRTTGNLTINLNKLKGETNG